MASESTSNAAGEQQPLLAHAGSDQHCKDTSSSPLLHAQSSKLLVTSFLAAFAIATTAATEVFAYAVIICDGGTQCDEDKRSSYAGTVAVSVTVANVVALLILGSFVTLSKRYRRAGLFLWILFRASSVIVLIIGVATSSIAVALMGRVFEGFASDNLLHFNLNSVYVQEPSVGMVSRLIGLSLTVYMIGICIGPAIAGLLPDFQTSFVVALAAFALNAVYLGAVNIKLPETEPEYDPATSLDGRKDATFPPQVFAHLRILRTHPQCSLPLSALFAYNMVQSFIFPAIMTYSTVTFGFTGRQNGFVISIVHAVAALYLLMTSYGVPQLRSWLRSSKVNADDRKLGISSIDRWSALAAIAASCAEAVSLGLLALIEEGWQLYPVVVLTAVGLATPAFIKSHAATLVPRSSGPDIIAALTVFETCGSLLSPVVVGSILAGQHGPLAFLVSAGILGISALLLGTSLLVNTLTTDRSSETEIADSTSIGPAHRHG